MRYIVVDPSGSFNEGKGHTGIAVMYDNDWSSITVREFKASDFNTRYDYWKSIIDYITASKSIYGFETQVILESFTVRANGFLVGKMPETFLFIGAICYELDKWKIPYCFQSPSSAKTRFKDEFLDKYIPDLERNEKGSYY